MARRSSPPTSKVSAILGPDDWVAGSVTGTTVPEDVAPTDVPNPRSPAATGTSPVAATSVPVPATGAAVTVDPVAPVVVPFAPPLLPEAFLLSDGFEPL
jgi:hypothetical protein